MSIATYADRFALTLDPDLRQRVRMAVAARLVTQIPLADTPAELGDWNALSGARRDLDRTTVNILELLVASASSDPSAMNDTELQAAVNPLVDLLVPPA